MASHCWCWSMTRSNKRGRVEQAEDDVVVGDGGREDVFDRLLATLQDAMRAQCVTIMARDGDSTSMKQPVYKLLPSKRIWEPHCVMANVPLRADRWCEEVMEAEHYSRWGRMSRSQQAKLLSCAAGQVWNLDHTLHRHLITFRGAINPGGATAFERAGGQVYDMARQRMTTFAAEDALYADRFFDADLEAILRDRPETPLFDSLFDRQGYDDQSKKVAMAVLGRQLIFPNNEPQPFMPLVCGPSNTGKSTLQEVLIYLCGGYARVHLMISEQNNRFALEGASDKTSILLQELQPNCKVSSSNFLSITNHNEPKIIDVKGRAAAHGVHAVPVMGVGNMWLDGLVEACPAAARRILRLPFQYVPETNVHDMARRIIREEGPVLAIRLPQIWREFTANMKRLRKSLMEPEIIGGQLHDFQCAINTTNHQLVWEWFNEDVLDMTRNSCIPADQPTLGEIYQAWREWCTRLLFDHRKMSETNIKAWLTGIDGVRMTRAGSNSSVPRFTCVQIKDRGEWYRLQKLPFFRRV